MRSARVSLSLLFLLLINIDMVKPSDNGDEADVTETVPVLETKSPTSPTPTSPTPTSPTPTSPTPSPTLTSPTLLATTKTPKTPESDEFLESFTCGKTRASCDVAFCPPWERCFEGRCTCKLPYLCPTETLNPVCGRDNRIYRSYCQVMALSCRTKKSFMSHFGENCDANLPKFTSSIDEQTGLVRLFIPNSSGVEELLVCKKFWNMAAANVACKEQKIPLGAASKDSVEYRSLGTLGQLPEKCVSVYCQGYETSLAECIIYDKVTIGSINGNKNVATATCYQKSTAPRGCPFTCANGKCVTLNQACNGIDDCGDRSDEMCCKKCKKNAFRCKTGMCVYKDALRDGQIDCLDGEDETEKAVLLQKSKSDVPKNSEYISPMNETKASRKILESKLYCGIPNATTVDDEEAGDRGRTSHGRAKRVVGGVPAKPTQIQWQVALEENRRIDCGGAYIGGCWVITAAHCVRPNPGAFRVKFSLWKKIRAQGTTDIVPVEDIFIHPNYIASTYQNDIALIKLKKLPFTNKCLLDNPAISAVCVPWSTQLFQPNHTCSISGWGRTAEGKSASVLLWANVSLIENCSQFYGDRFKPGMMCAGDLEGSVDSCQGDSGGPLVCKDELGVSYLWGIVSWGERCGQPGFPGVYTQVAHYFEWIRLQTGWPAVTKFNS
ncbi:complement factor I [Archocentrus centrarchus]|uniref:complement factor I n=1 Tax=Archocentrus centrarchus TaxID=63155 RepID=UPI0011E9EDE9|nr:complement factor I [Archocentrus centrarchus]